MESSDVSDVLRALSDDKSLALFNMIAVALPQDSQVVMSRYRTLLQKCKVEDNSAKAICDSLAMPNLSFFHKEGIEGPATDR